MKCKSIILKSYHILNGKSSDNLFFFFLGGGVGGGGEPILVVVKILGKINVLLTEAMALHEGLFQHYQYQKVSVEGNSKLLIDGINNVALFLGISSS